MLHIELLCEISKKCIYYLILKINDPKIAKILEQIFRIVEE